MLRHELNALRTSLLARHPQMPPRTPRQTYRKASSAVASSIVPTPAPTAHVPATPSTSPFVRPFKAFYDEGVLSQGMLKAIPHTLCSEVQGMTMRPIFEGNDVYVPRRNLTLSTSTISFIHRCLSNHSAPLAASPSLAQAKTGTGKTLAFLIPSIQRIQQPPDDGSISILVLSPTRELATQITQEAEKLASSLSFRMDCFTGGKPEGGQQRRLAAAQIDILVAVSSGTSMYTDNLSHQFTWQTPGRLSWHIDNTPGFIKKLAGVKTLIFDEVDRLLDGGFARDIDKLLAAFPRGVQRFATCRDTIMLDCHLNGLLS